MVYGKFHQRLFSKARSAAKFQAEQVPRTCSAWNNLSDSITHVSTLSVLKSSLIKAILIVSQALAHVIFVRIGFFRSCDLYRWPAMCAHVQASTSAAYIVFS